MLKQHQPPMTLSQQIENLKGIGLKIENEDEAERFLSDVSYFRLMKAYSLTLKERNGNYQDGATFAQIKDLYLFNSNFRQALFPLIELVEINLRCRLSNLHCNKHGVFGYENPDFFTNRLIVK